MMTQDQKQNIFNMAYAYAKTMKRPAVNSDTSCRYRDDQGNMCLIGSMITDEVYANSPGKLEGKPAYEVLVAEALEKSLGHQILEHSLHTGLRTMVHQKDFYFLRDLQSAHDSNSHAWDEATFATNVCRALDIVAIKYDLSIPG